MLEEPVEILVGMAERGEIDPWNIDIVEITDRFFSELERLKELDLRISGRTLFYAASLLRLKSEYLDHVEGEVEGEFVPDEEDEFLDEFGFDGEFGLDDIAEPIERLEREIQRRIGRKLQRKRPQTLYELIKILKTAEKEERRRHRRRVTEEYIPVDVDDVVGIAHEEDYTEVTENVLSCFLQVREYQANVTLEEIARVIGRAQPEVYIPLLFLMIEGKLIIFQHEFFGEILVAEWSKDAFDDY